MKKIVLATRNKDKTKEIKEIFKRLKLDIEILSILKFPNIPEVEEDGKTLKENAKKKAKVVGDITGLPTLSEDTGLFVDYLNGAPGVYSSCYADTDPKKHTATYEDNYKKLLKELEGVPWEKKDCEICLYCVSLYPTKK